MHITKQKLKDLLLASEVVKERDFNLAEEEARRANQEIIEVLIGRGDISEEYLLELLEPVVGASLVDLEKKTIPTEVLELVPENYAKSKGLVLFEVDKADNTAKIGMRDPLDFEAVEFLRAKLNMWVEPFLVTSSSLRYGLRQYKKEMGLEFDDIISQNVKKFLSVSGETDLVKLARAVPIVTILDSIVSHAIALNASDIHFEPMESNLVVRFRVDGVLQEVLSLHKLIESILAARVKILANLQIDEHRVPQDGRFRFEMEDGAYIDIRVNIMPVMHGEKVEMRLLKSGARPLTLEELGLSGAGIAVVKEEILKPHGMILVTGPTGHGKTTTLYTILHMLNTPKVNITTIEDPIEYEVGGINQTQVNVKAGITFANGLRALLRQNPDIIMVGEIRDGETVEIAVQAALTGHLVLSSLHTNDAPSALPRLLDMGAQAFLLSSTVNLVIAQRLVRKICTSCVESYKMPPETKALISSQMQLLGDTHIKAVPDTIFRGKGCNVCGNTGFRGQIGIFEVLRASDKIRELMQKLAPVSDIRKTAIAEGMTTMLEDGLEKIQRGVTTVEEVLRVVSE